MWASARDELLRPGLRGGGGGKPLLPVAGLGGGAATGIAAGADKTFALAGLEGAGVDFGSALTATLAAWVGKVFAPGLTTCLLGVLEAALTGALVMALVGALTLGDCFLATGLTTALATGFFSPDLGAVDFAGFDDLDRAALAADLAGALNGALTGALDDVLAAGLPAGLALELAGFLTTHVALGLGAGLTVLTGFTATLMAALTVDLAADLPVGLAAALDAVLGMTLDVDLAADWDLPAVLLAGLVAGFAGFVFTACLLWEAASG